LVTSSRSSAPIHFTEFSDNRSTAIGNGSIAVLGQFGFAVVDPAADQWVREISFYDVGYRPVDASVDDCWVSDARTTTNEVLQLLVCARTNVSSVELVEFGPDDSIERSLMPKDLCETDTFDDWLFVAGPTTSIQVVPSQPRSFDSLVSSLPIATWQWGASDWAVTEIRLDEPIKRRRHQPGAVPDIAVRVVNESIVLATNSEVVVSRRRHPSTLNATADTVSIVAAPDESAYRAALKPFFNDVVIRGSV
jgi:hypothetical protein